MTYREWIIEYARLHGINHLTEHQIDRAMMVLIGDSQIWPLPPMFDSSNPSYDQLSKAIVEP